MAAFSRGFFSLTLVGKIILSETLVNLGDGVPAGAVLLDAALLHEEVDEILLLLANLAEVMEERPAVDVKGVLDVLQEGAFASVGDVVVCTRVAKLGVRDTDGDFILLLAVRNDGFGRTDDSEFDEFGLDAAVVQTHGISTTVPVDEPLTQVGRHFDVDVEVAHNIWCEIVTSAKIQQFSVACIRSEKRLRFVIW